MKSVEISRERGAFVLRASVWTRAWAGLERGVLWGGVGLFGLLVMFSPDVLYEWIWGRVEGSPSVPVLIVSMAGLAGLVGVISGMVRALRSDVWAFEPDTGKLRFQTAPLVGEPVDEAVSLSSIRAIRVSLEPGVGESSIRVQMSDGRPDETLVESRIGAASIQEAAKQLEAFFDEHDLGVDIRYDDVADVTNKDR